MRGSKNGVKGFLFLFYDLGAVLDFALPLDLLAVSTLLEATWMPQPPERYSDNFTGSVREESMGLTTNLWGAE